MILSELHTKGVQFATDRFVQLTVVDIEHKSSNQGRIDFLLQLYFFQTADLLHQSDQLRALRFSKCGGGDHFCHLDGTVQVVLCNELFGHIQEDVFSVFSRNNLKNV